jgi:F-type H+-transporting ATPase subunit a
LALAFTLLVGVLLVGFFSHRFLLLAAFIPAGTPLGLIPLMILLELLAYSTRTLSLGLRLAVNMITGHILAKVSVGFIWVAVYSVDTPNVLVLLLLSFPMLLLLLFQGLEILIAYLQAYIFTFITSITIKDLLTSPQCFGLISLFITRSDLISTTVYVDQPFLDRM